jgi:hypothetical protein
VSEEGGKEKSHFHENLNSRENRPHIFVSAKIFEKIIYLYLYLLKFSRKVQIVAKNSTFFQAAAHIFATILAEGNQTLMP